MRRAWKITLGLVLAVVAWVYLFTGTPPFGRRLALSDKPISSIEFEFLSSRRETSSSNLCTEVVQALRKARDGGSVHACPILGTLTLRYADGATNRLTLMRGHRLNRLDLIHHSGMYSMSMREMLGTLERVGLLDREHLSGK